VNLAEWAASNMLAKSALADRNNSFLQWILTHNQLSLASKIAIRALPEDVDVPLGEVQAHVGSRSVHYYVGTDRHMLTTFANDGACLLHVVQVNPRRSVQLRYLSEILKVPQVPDTVQITKVYGGPELTHREASILLRIASILREDYLIANVEPSLAEISHSVSVFAKKEEDKVKLYISRSGSLLPPLFEFHEKAIELFFQFMKDFVRVHIYPHIQQFVPSSTRDGVDALRKILERNRELYRYEEAEMGDFEGILGDYLSGKLGFVDVLQQAHSRVRPQTQSVASHQVGSVESEVPGVIDSPIVVNDSNEGANCAPSPPIIRDSVSSNMKILTTSERYSQLNGFKVLLGLSDRVMLTESEFFRTPHTTRILWGGHRVIYIFTEATGRLSLYYDISLREPIEHSQAGGGMFQTTTLITKNRIFVPVPDALSDAFKIAKGSKEFYVRFDVVSSDVI
jgi:molecular chaperone HtpG